MTETPTERNQRIFQEATDAGEPVFVIRAKDRYAIGIANDYAHRAAGLGDDFLDALADLTAEMKAWRAANPDKVKTPDLRP